MSQSLAAEVEVYGIHVTLIEPIMFPTDLAAASPQSQPNPAYAHAREALYAGASASDFVPGDPAATSAALLEVADAPRPPLRVLFGAGGLEALRTEFAGRLAGLEEWDHISRLAQATSTRRGSDRRDPHRSLVARRRPVHQVPPRLEAGEESDPCGAGRAAFAALCDHRRASGVRTLVSWPAVAWVSMLSRVVGALGLDGPGLVSP
ncbi:hypothetical protein [Actinacidiphila glaucinigra]|uniref:hypothetical protein n=1 Tax=Actinacidiphila glaucinigra TaxID=235986 RepID=UPI0035D52DE5